MIFARHSKSRTNKRYFSSEGDDTSSDDLPDTSFDDIEVHDDISSEDDPDNLEIDDHIDNDDDDNSVDIISDGEDAVDDVNDDLDEVEDLHDEITALFDTKSAIESYGIHPSTIGVMKATGLLNGTALEFVGIESFGSDGPKGPESQMALESIFGKIGEKIAEYSAKVMSVIKKFGSGIMSVLSKIWNKLTGIVKTVSGFVWDKAKALGRMVKAHPYATAAAVVAAIVAVAGVISFINNKLPGVTVKPEVLEKYNAGLKSLTERIKYPFDEAKVLIKGQHAYCEIVPGGPGILHPEKLGLLGWTKVACTSLSSKMDRAWAAIKDSMSGMVSMLTKGFAKHTPTVTGAAKAGASGLLGGIKTGGSVLLNAIKFVGVLLKYIVLGGFSFIKGTFMTIAGAFGKSAEVARVAAAA